MSEIRVENIIGETGTDAVKFTKGINVTGVTTATTFSGSGASLTNLPAANLTGSLPAISGANLTGVAGKILDIKTVRHTTSASFNVGSTNLASANVFYFPYTSNAMLQINYARTNASSSIILQGHYSVNTSTNSHAMYAFIAEDSTIRKNLAVDEHNAKREYLNQPFFCMFTSAELGSSANVGVTRAYTVSIGSGDNRTHTGTRSPNMNGSYSDTSNAPHYSELTLMEVVAS